MRSSAILEKEQVKTMLRYEIKKVLCRPSGKIALILLAATVLFAFFTSAGSRTDWIDENGNAEHGHAAVVKLQNAQHQWKGYLDEAKLADVIRELNAITSTDAWRGTDTEATDAAYGKMFGFLPVREILRQAFLDDLFDFDWYRADSLTPDQAEQLYSNRVRLMEKYLNSGACELNDNEKAYLLQCYQELDTPFYFDYKEGWAQLLDAMTYIMLFGYIILGFLISGIFSGEFKYRADSILFSTKLGRSRAPSVKILAGFVLMTTLYWGCILAITAMTLGYAGASGGNCPVQFDYWRSMYNLTYFQAYCLYAFSGYIGMLFMGLLCMWVSSKTRSAVFASALPILLLFVPNFIVNSISDSGVGAMISSILALLPDKLLDVSHHLKTFCLYDWGTVLKGWPIILVLYGCLTVLLVPMIHRDFGRKQVK